MIPTICAETMNRTTHQMINQIQHLKGAGKLKQKRWREAFPSSGSQSTQIKVNLESKNPETELYKQQNKKELITSDPHPDISSPQEIPHGWNHPHVSL